jgi:hypothetical protein
LNAVDVSATIARMEITSEKWAFIITLAAVVNGLGIVRLLSSLGEYLKTRGSLNIRQYWVYNLLAVFQLLAHLLLWWSILGLPAAGNINFLSYLYLLIGPTLLYLGTSVMLPESKSTSLDMRREYYDFRKSYYSILTGFWLWAIFAWPVFGHDFSPTLPMLLIWLAISIILRFTENPKAHATLIIANCTIYASFVAMFAMQPGAVGSQMAG